MGLTKGSVGSHALQEPSLQRKKCDGERIIALAGNPNVGKSTVFNALTGMNQHTGNWPGKTVTSARGYCRSEKIFYTIVDIPGTYSLMAHSAEEEVARDFICFGSPDAVVVVCDATCLERNMNLALQILEVSPRTVVCVNLLDEARKKGINIDLELLSKRLGVPVVGVIARKKRTLSALLSVLDALPNEERGVFSLRYPDEIEEAVEGLVPPLERSLCDKRRARWIALRLLGGDEGLKNRLSSFINADGEMKNALSRAKEYLMSRNIDTDRVEGMTAGTVVKCAEELCRGVVSYERKEYDASDRRLDRILTGRLTAYPIMIVLLSLIFWITITAANYPSAWLSSVLFRVQDMLTALFIRLGAPDWLHGIVVLGAYRVLAWVVSVMLPPMAIFFPLFTLLEDSGYLPRIAYNLDKPFARCNACGKQALTMCMGFGCNAAGVVGCRIIDSPRERLLAILTNSFVPCNGRFPMLISIITMFFIGTTGVGSGIVASLVLTGVILIGIFATFGVTKLLSKTLLRGVPSSFTLEMPPYRTPQVARVIVRSLFDRTLFVLGRAAAVAAPAGAVIWLMANISVGDVSLLRASADLLDPFARFLGLDGVILIAFILGLPANEIVIPIIIMAYMAEGTIVDLGSVMQMKELFVANGWTWVTAGSVILFSLLHWPCSTTLMTVRKETGSWYWTLLAAILPTTIGIAACAIFANFSTLFI